MKYEDLPIGLQLELEGEVPAGLSREEREAAAARLYRQRQSEEWAKALAEERCYIRGHGGPSGSMPPHRERGYDGRLYFVPGLVAPLGWNLACLVGGFLHGAAASKIAKYGEDAYEWDTPAAWGKYLGIGTTQAWAVFRDIEEGERLWEAMKAEDEAARARRRRRVERMERGTPEEQKQIERELQREKRLLHATSLLKVTRKRLLIRGRQTQVIELKPKAALIKMANTKLQWVSRHLRVALGFSETVMFQRIRHDCRPKERERKRTRPGEDLPAILGPGPGFTYHYASLSKPHAMPWLGPSAMRMVFARLLEQEVVERERVRGRPVYRVPEDLMRLTDLGIAERLQAAKKRGVRAQIRKHSEFDQSAQQQLAKNTEKSEITNPKGPQPEAHKPESSAHKSESDYGPGHCPPTGSDCTQGAITQGALLAPAAPVAHRERFAGEGAPASAPTGASAGSPPRRERVSAVAGEVEETEETDKWGAEAAMEEADRQREEEEQSIRIAYEQHLDHIREMVETEVSETETETGKVSAVPPTTTTERDRQLLRSLRVTAEMETETGTGTVRGKASPVDSAATVAVVAGRLPPTTERDRQLLRNLAACDLHRLCDWATTDPAVVVIAAAAGVRLTRPDQPPGWSPAEAAAADARWRRLMAHHRALDLRLDPSGSFAR